MQSTERSQLRQIPSVEKILSSSEFEPLIARFGRQGVKLRLRAELDSLRRSARFSGFSLSKVAQSVERSLSDSLSPTLIPVINGTGIIIHTNLGRSPIGSSTWSGAAEVTTRYSNLEFELGEGERGARDQHISSLASQLFGCEAAILVNNNAGAVLLLLAAIAAGKDVLVSRGELVEIGGSFRIPDVITQGGARLREVGTTNRTRKRDYAEALGRRTAAILKVHRSNFQLVGFTESATVEELVEVARGKNVPVVMDEGSGRVVDLARYGFSAQPTIAELLAAGLDAVTCSTDKLIGSLQGGLILGKRSIIDRCSRHPLMRALRAGKESYGTLARTLASFLSGKYEQDIPIYQMLSASVEDLRQRAGTLSRQVGATVMETQSALGGGTTPAESIASVGIALDGPGSGVAARLRRWTPPIIGRIDQDRCILDLRTIAPDEDEIVAEALRA